MRYLGGIRGAGVLSLGEETLGRVDFDFDGYQSRPGEVTGSGEIRSEYRVLKHSFGMKGVRLVTDDGRTFTLRYTEKALKAASVSAHVDVVGDLPKTAKWGT